MTNRSGGTSLSISPARKRLFGIITILIPLLLVIALELLLRLFGYGFSHKLFMAPPDPRFEQYLACYPDMGRKYFNRYEYSSPPNDTFLKEKPDSAFRIFVLGSSTVVGFPYGYNLMFTRILHNRLQSLYPNKRIEVVNTAITAINSYTLADFTKKILREKPDAILIYAGHNEFYGALGVGSNEGIGSNPALIHLHLSLLNFRTYQLLRNAMSGVLGALSGANAPDEIRGTLMTRIAGSKDIPYGSSTYNAGIKQYEHNLSLILAMAKRRGVPVLISEVVSNVRDLSPFSSPPTEGYPLAMDVFNKARGMEKAGEMDEARKLYYLAKDLDGIRFRASEDINQTIRRLAEKYDAHVVPMQRSFEQHSPNGLIGNNLMTEHVHPNIEGYFLMADVFYREMVAMELIGPMFPPYHINAQYHKRNWGYTPLDSIFGNHRVANLMHHWPFRPLNAAFIDYRVTYNPTSFLDSLAFDVVKQPGARIYNAHKHLARHYVNTNQHYLAYREFLAAITIAPFFPDDYIGAIHSLVSINDYPTAAVMVEQFLELEESFYGYFYRGEFEMFRFNYNAALEAYSKAAPFVSNASQRESLLGKQFIALHFDGQTQRANAVLEEIKKHNPDYQPVIPTTRKHFVLFIPEYIETKVMAGFELYQAGDHDQALDILSETIQVKGTPIANRVIGEILSRRNDPNALIPLVRAYPYFSNDISFLNNLTIGYARAGMSKEANGILAQIESIDPTNQRIPRLRELIDGMGIDQ